MMELKHIRELGRIVTGNTPPTKDSKYYGDYMLFIKATDISENGKFTYETEESYSRIAYEKYKQNLVPKGSTCVVTIGSVGKKLTKAHCDLFVNQAINAVVPNEEYNEDYIYYLLKNNLVQLKLFDSGTASGRENISKSSFSKIRVLVELDKHKQNTIAEILSLYDELIENNNKRIKILEQMAEELYKEWFVRFRYPGYENERIEKGIPEKWEVDRIKNVVKRFSFGKTYKERELHQEGKVIVIDQSAKQYIGYHNENPGFKANIENPILLFGDHSCKYVLMTTEFSLGENVIPYKSLDETKINNYYLFYATKNILKTEEYKRHWGRFSNLKILIPCIELQTKFQSTIIPMIEEMNYMFKKN